MSNIIFKGLKSVLKSAYNSTPLEEKIGYVWFVRDNKTDDRGEIYLGSRFYGTSRGDALTEEYVNTLINEKVNEVKKQVESLISGNVLKFYCIEEVIVTLNGNSIKYPANTSVEIFIDDGDIFDITTSSDNSIYSLSSYPGAINVFHPWLNGVQLFDGILFDMNNRDMYIHWSEYTQGVHHVQLAQYNSCIFWSDIEYISEYENRNNYCLLRSSQLPLCYSNIDENTFKPFFNPYSATNDPNWGNRKYTESFSLTTISTKPFSHYGSTNIGAFDDINYNVISLPINCEGLMYHSPNIISAGVFDAMNTQTFGAMGGSYYEAFGLCSSLKHLYIKNLKVSLNISWSHIEQSSLNYILRNSANESNITIYLSPYTYYRLTSDNIELSNSRNIRLELINGNSDDDNRLKVIGTIDGEYAIMNKTF